VRLAGSLSRVVVYDQLPVPFTKIDTPQQAVDAMPDAAQLRLIVGEGRLGSEWLKSIELVER
jgi:hypothetical protein